MKAPGFLWLLSNFLLMKTRASIDQLHIRGKEFIFLKLYVTSCPEYFVWHLGVHYVCSSMAIRPKFELHVQFRDTVYSHSGYATEK